MVHNYGNEPAEPHVFVYCGGKKVGEASPPSSPPRFVSDAPGIFGVMWRAADVTTHVASSSGRTECTVSLPAGPDSRTPYVTTDNPYY
jgi:hypothetical protein